MKATVQINFRCAPEVGEMLKRLAETQSAAEGRKVTYAELIQKALVAMYEGGRDGNGNGNGGTKKGAESSTKTQQNRGVMAVEELPALAIATEVPQLYVDGKHIPPDLNSVINFFKEHGSSKDEAERFYDHFQGNGWRVSKVAMKDWHAAARNWIRNAADFKARATGWKKNRSMEDIAAETDRELQELLEKGYLYTDEYGNVRVAGDRSPLLYTGAQAQ